MGELNSRQIFARNLQYYMGINGKTRRDMCRLMGVSFSTFSSWFNGERFPRIEKIDMLTTILGCTREDLMSDSIILNKSQFPTAPNDKLSDSKRELLEFVQAVPDEKAALILQAMKLILEASE